MTETKLYNRPERTETKLCNRLKRTETDQYYRLKGRRRSFIPDWKNWKGLRRTILQTDIGPCEYLCCVSVSVFVVCVFMYGVCVCVFMYVCGCVCVCVLLVSLETGRTSSFIVAVGVEERRVYCVHSSMQSRQ